ncbi:MAG: 4-hydroxythreonine-4-phosphate dehydrogenase PdxA [Planctomycetes bacterium]|nr:4-hydroxythreonine-4-phosphate dehydrogenase PdxA [Planctomycetota bacterium]
MSKVIGITMGDPCGVGPEVALKAISLLPPGHEPLVIGSGEVLQRTAEGLGLKPDWKERVKVLDLANFDPGKTPLREPNPEAGRASLEYVLKGIELALKGEIGALVTGPISKEALHLAGYPYPGHTEILKEKTGAPRVTMMMVVGDFRVSFVTIHVPLKEVPRLLSPERVLATIKLTHKGLKEWFHVERPRIGVCALNPHAGEGGCFGSEEGEVILPAIRAAQEAGINCSGPIPADVACHKAHEGELEVVVALYHDQGTIAIKLLGFFSGVNLTLGLPIVRTSPTHGTAFDIAGKGLAQPGSMLEAIKLAARLKVGGRG